MPIINIKTQFNIRKERLLQRFCIYLVVCSEFLLSPLRSGAFITVAKLIVDAAWIVLFFFFINTLDFKTDKPFRVFISFFSVFVGYLLLGGLLRFESVLSFSLGLRKTIRFYILFFACYTFLERKNVYLCFSFFDFLFWLNVIVTVYQFFVLNISQDYLGGLFGVGKGVNGATTAFLSFIVCGSIIGYLNKREGILPCLLKCGFSLIISAMAELKFFFVLFVFILVVAIFITKPSLRKISIVFLSIVVLLIGNILIEIIFGEPITFRKIIDLVLAEHYSSNSDLGRLTAISTLSKEILADFPSRLLGLGIGNCEPFSLGREQSFYIAYGNLHYQWFASAVIFLETGYLGITFHLLFFVICFVSAYSHTRDKRYEPIFCQISMIMSVICAIITFYNASIRSEIAFLLYFSLALHLIPVQKSN